MTYRLPAEWETQRSVWLTWPGNPETWKRLREEAKRDHAFLVSACSRFQPVDLICCSVWQEDCMRHLEEMNADLSRITFHDWPVNDAWTRDHGAVFVQTAEGPAVMDLPFNAWGGKFSPWETDDMVARRMSEVRKVPCRRFPYIGEGGGLESNGAGTLLVTESVWLNPNRNPGASRKELDSAFREFLGVNEVFWLPEGMASDDTDGHIDTVARFVDEETVVDPLPSAGDADFESLKQNRSLLQQRFRVIDLPHPPLKHLPASYANFLLINGAVLVPTYGVDEDEQALRTLGGLFPDRQTVGIPSRTFLEEGGAVHCLTMQEPA